MGNLHIFIVCNLFILLATASDPAAAKKHHGHDLSSESHEVDGHHNPRYDEEALFGKDSPHLGDLSHEEGVEQLRKLFQKMDGNQDRFVDHQELHDWLLKVQRHMGIFDVKRVWKEHNLKPDQKLTWQVYSTQAVKPDGIYEDEDKAEQEQHLARDKRRWDAADVNKDGELSLEEAVAFLNPESDPKMRDLLVQETIDEMDKNKDGFIDMEEFIADMWTPTEHEPNEPDWVKSEREDFKKNRDLNGDGKLDMKEITLWRFSPSFDYIENEVVHLIQKCDTNGDNRLTEEEIVDQYGLFANSAATSYGEVLGHHDEL